MHLGGLALGKDQLGRQGPIELGLPGGHQGRGRRQGTLQIQAGAGDGPGGSGHLGVVAEGATGGRSLGGQNQPVQAHRQHQASARKQLHGLLGAGDRAFAAAGRQGLGHQPLVLKPLQQAGVLAPVEGQPEHLPIRACG